MDEYFYSPLYVAIEFGLYLLVSVYHAEEVGRMVSEDLRAN